MSPPAPRRGAAVRRARASRAARLEARARNGQPRAAACPPAAAQSLLAAAGTRAFQPAAAARPSHAVRGAQTVRAEGRPQASSPHPAALSPLAQSFSLRSSFQRGQTQGARRWRVGVSAPLGERTDPAGSRQRPGSARRTRPQLCSAGKQASEREQSLLSLREPRASWAPESGGTPKPRPEPGAVRDRRRRGGCSCTRECGLPPRQLGRVWQPAGITCSWRLPGPRSAQPRLLLSRCSWRPRRHRRLSRCHRRRACAPHARTPARTPPPPQPGLLPRQRPDPASRRPRPPTTPTARAPPSTTAAPQLAQWPSGWGRECGA